MGYTGAYRLYVMVFGAVVVPLSCTNIKEQALFQVEYEHIFALCFSLATVHFLHLNIMAVSCVCVCVSSVLRNNSTKKYNFKIPGSSVCMKILNASRPSEHPPLRGENVKTFIRWDHRQQRQNLFMTFKRFPRC